MAQLIIYVDKVENPGYAQKPGLLCSKQKSSFIVPQDVSLHLGMDLQGKSYVVGNKISFL